MHLSLLSVARVEIPEVLAIFFETCVEKGGMLADCKTANVAPWCIKRSTRINQTITHQIVQSK